MKDNKQNPSDPNAEIKNKLAAFIESLSQNLPATSTTLSQQTKFPTNSSTEPQNLLPKLGKTSDLLDTLQNALSQPPTADLSLFPLQAAVQLDNVNQSPLDPSAQPLNLHIDLTNDESNILSRTLKRKFTELDEISQRLKARLFDVTADKNFNPDEEFEKDLNTVVDGMDDNDENLEDFGWLKKEENLGENLLQQTTEESQPSTSKVPTAETSQFSIDES